MEINCYYSSDEDVAWGPLSIREIRREFSKSNRKPPVRRTDFPKPSEVCQELQNASESITSSNMEYYTANETEPEFKSDQERNDKIESTAFEPSANIDIITLSSDEEEETSRCFSVSGKNLKHEFDCEVSTDSNSSKSKFNDNEKKETSRYSSVSGKNLKHKFDCQVSTDSNSSKSKFNDNEEKETSRCSSVNGKNLKHKFDCQVSTDSNSSQSNFNDNEEEETSRCSSVSGKNLKHKFECEVSTDSNSSQSKFSDSEEKETCRYSSVSGKNLKHEFDCEVSTDSNSSQSKFNDSEENETSRYSSVCGKNLKHKFDCEVSTDSNSSPSKFNDNEEELFLNDTLAEIENLINNGLEVTSESEEEIIQTSPKYSVNSSRSVSQVEEPISRIPILISSSNESFSSNTSSLRNFKMPFTPRSARKLTPIKKSPNRFKDIISPIRMYINNSPHPILKQNHRPITGERSLGLIPERCISLIKHRNLVKSLPEVVYKPSDTVIEKFNSEIILPDNIRKLVKERTVIKHEVRTSLDLNESEFSTGEKLRRADLSCVMRDVKNMSIHSAKQGFNI